MRRVVDDDLDEFFGRPAPVVRPKPAARAEPRATSKSSRGPGSGSRSAAGSRSTAAKRSRQRSPHREARSAKPTAARPAPPTRSANLRSVPTGATSTRPAPLDRVGRVETRPPRPSHRPVSRSGRERPAPRPKRRSARVRRVEDGYTSRRRTLVRLVWLVVVATMIVVAITVRLVTIHVAESDTWVEFGRDQREGWRDIPAGRGGIYDRNGQAFAMSVIQPDLVADPRHVDDERAAARLLAPVLDVDPADLEEKLSVGGAYSLLASELTIDVAAEIDELRQEQAELARSTGGKSPLDGIVLRDRFVRFSPTGDLAQAVVGRTVAGGGVDESGREGVSGIEWQFDDDLTGRAGRISYEHDPRGRAIAGGAERVEPARPGTDIYLTLDQALQHEAERAISEQVEATGAASGMVVMMRPSTGEILAMTSVAVDDEGEVVNTRDNRPVTAVFEPGSVNKMITVAGALEEGLMEPDTVLEVPDHLTIHDKTFTDHDPHPVRAWSVTDILVTSSNIGTIKIARTLGREKVDGYLREFGLGETTGLGFPNEENGIMLSLEDWSGTSIGAIPIGQGIAVTALQMLAAYNVIANDGVYVAPRLVAGTDSGSGRVESAASANRRVVSVETAKALQSMLEMVVTDGTGKRAQVPDYPAAGKTGTARIPQGVDPTDGYLGRDGRYHYQSTFLGFVSGADLSILVTLQDPQTSSYGGEVAAPVFSELAGFALIRSQTPPPALLEAPSIDVPEISATARGIGEGGAPAGTAPATTAPAG